MLYRTSSTTREGFKWRDWDTYPATKPLTYSVLRPEFSRIIIKEKLEKVEEPGTTKARPTGNSWRLAEIREPVGGLK